MYKKRNVNCLLTFVNITEEFSPKALIFIFIFKTVSACSYPKHLMDKVSLTLKMQPFSCDLQIMGRLLPASDLYVASWTSKDNQANFRADKI